jgi:hypothetical protein
MVVRAIRQRPTGALLWCPPVGPFPELVVVAAGPGAAEQDPQRRFLYSFDTVTDLVTHHSLAQPRIARPRSTRFSMDWRMEYATGCRPNSITGHGRGIVARTSWGP